MLPPMKLTTNDRIQARAGRASLLDVQTVPFEKNAQKSGSKFEQDAIMAAIQLAAKINEQPD